MPALAELIGESPGLVAVRERISRLVARASDVRRLPPVLIQGETGTGKGLIARALHRAGPRAQGPFVDVNCAAIPETLLEAEMFGYERGAFTDARQAKRGLFQTAHRGTLFLDEIGLLPEGLQAKLLTVLEERTVRRLGATQSEPVDVWIIAATNADLQAATGSGRFREDLYHRLAVLTLVLPPLRERGADVLLLAEHLLGRACADYGLPRRTLSPDARAALLAHPWPGNVRELANVMERVALLSEAPVVTAELLALPEAARRGSPAPTAPSAAPPAPATLADTVDSAERAHVLEALEATGWNVSRAAVRLGVSRNTLRYRIEKHGLRPGAPAPPRRPRTAEPGARAPSPAPAPAPAAPAPAPEPAAAAVRWERRRLTLLRVVAGDVADPGPSAEATRAIEIGVEKVQAFGGRIEDLSPTGLAAAFGVDPAEDAARRAALAALAIQTALRRAAEGGEAGHVSVGIHLAPVLIGRVGGTSLIDREDKAAALAGLDAALRVHGPAGIIVTAAAAPFLARRFELSPLGGPAAGAPAFRLEGIEPPGARPGRTARFVDREHELRLLQSRFDAAARGQGQAVAITGEAGIGKSRLLAELHGSLTGEAVRFLAGSAHSFGTAIPYLVVVDILRAATGIVEGDAPDVVRRKVEQALAAAGLSPEEDGPFIVALLSPPESTDAPVRQAPELVKARTSELFRELVLRQSRSEPVVLAVEDLHWIDRTSEECLAALVNVIAGARVLVVTTHRPGYRPSWLDRSYATQMALQPLGPEDSQTVVRDVLGERVAPAPVVELALAKAEGNPFFLEELGRAIRERPAAHSVAVPDTVEEVLLARIDQLPPEEKAALQCAAVVGKSVPRGLLQIVWDVEEAAQRRVLARLQAAEFLLETRSGPDAEYEFKHALTHDVAYGSLLPAQRRALHARLLAGIERRHAGSLEDHAERLAHHAAGAEAWEAVVGHARQAGTKALARSAHSEAAAWFDEAIAALRRLPEHGVLLERAIDLRLELRTALLPVGEFARIHEALQEAETLAETLGDRRRLARVWAYMTDYFRQTGDSARGREIGQRALETAEALGDLPLQVATRIYLGHVYYDLGDYQRGADHFRRVVELISGGLGHDRLGLPYVPSVHARAWLALCLGEMGAFDEGARVAAEALEIAEGLEHPLSLISACVAVGRVCQRRGDAARAVPALERGLTLSRAWHIRLWIPTICESLGLARLMAGALPEALAALKEGVARHETMRGTAALSPRVSALGQALVATGEIEAARPLAARALEIARQHGERGNEAQAHWLAGEVAGLGASPDPVAAEASYRQAIALAGSLGMRPLVARGFLDLARLCARTGRTDDAAQARAQALDLFRRLGMDAWIERAGTEAGRPG